MQGNQDPDSVSGMPPRSRPSPSYIGVVEKRLRTAAGLSQGEVAKSVGVSQGLISQLENGDVQDPGATVLYRMAGLFGVSLYDFFEEPSPEQVEESLREFLATRTGRSLPPALQADLRTMKPRSGRPDLLYWAQLADALKRLSG